MPTLKPPTDGPATHTHTHTHTHTQAQRTGEPPLRDVCAGAREGQGSLRTSADFLWEAWRLLHTHAEQNQTGIHTYIPKDTHSHAPTGYNREE